MPPPRGTSSTPGRSRSSPGRPVPRTEWSGTWAGLLGSPCPGPDGARRARGPGRWGPRRPPGTGPSRRASGGPCRPAPPTARGGGPQRPGRYESPFEAEEAGEHDVPRHNRHAGGSLLPSGRVRRRPFERHEAGSGDAEGERSRLGQGDPEPAVSPRHRLEGPGRVEELEYRVPDGVLDRDGTRVEELPQHRALDENAPARREVDPRIRRDRPDLVEGEVEGRGLHGPRAERG